MASPDSLLERQADIRREALERRTAQPDKDELSRRITRAGLELPEYAAAGTVMFYLDVRSEVRTKHELPRALATEKRVAIPWWEGEGQLELFRLTAHTELVRSRFGSLEPLPELRAQPSRQVKPAEVDFFLVPGAAFDRTGVRLGQGRGYFDRLLAQRRPNSLLVALAFECQVYAEIPAAPRNVRVDVLITEQGVIRCQT